MEMVPRVGEPPAVPLTDQVTAVFVVPETAAVKARESPVRMFAVGGATRTAIDGGGGGGGCSYPEVAAAQPAKDKPTKAALRWSSLRIFANTHQEHTSTELVCRKEWPADTGREGRSGAMSLDCGPEG
jgi:hypothetical protein